MGIPGSANLLMLGGGAPAYEIEQSLRFAGETNQYLYRTGAITAQGGVSLWVKFHRNVNTYTAGIYDPIIYLSGGGPWLYRNPYGYLYYRSISSGGDSTWSAQRTRDHSAWYHIFLKFNSSNSTSLYVNNVLWGTKSANIGTANSNQRIGYDGTYLAQCYLAEYHAAFGESLDATDFGEYDDNGVWVPKKFTGNYGSQGFYLKFDPSAANGLGHDHSGNGNHFTDAGGFTVSNGSYIQDCSTVSGNTSQSFGRAFDGDLATQSASTNFSGEVWTWTPSGGYAYSSSVEVYGGEAAFDQARINNDSYVAMNGGWKTIKTGSGTITKLDVRDSRGNAAATIGAIRIDGTILIDNLFQDVLSDTP